MNVKIVDTRDETEVCRYYDWPITSQATVDWFGDVRAIQSVRALNEREADPNRFVLAPLCLCSVGNEGSEGENEQ